jgi:hypothetical protein
VDSSPYPNSYIEHVRIQRKEWQESAEDEYFREEPEDKSWITHAILSLGLRDDQIAFLGHVSRGETVANASRMAGHIPSWGRDLLRRIREELDPAICP